MTPEPSAPPFEDELVDYNCEAGCDVEFLVGSYPENVIRIPVHSHKLMGFEIFKAMLSEKYIGMREGYDRGDVRMTQIPVRDIDGKAFDNLMRFVYNKPLNLHHQTPEMVIETLKAAHKYLLSGLVWMCVKHMSTLISLNSVIWIYANVRYLCNDLDNLEELTKLEAHKPIPKRRKHSSLVSPGIGEHDHLSAGSEIKRLCVWLLGQTLNFIDVHAGHVLQSDEVEQLDRPFLEFLLKRDTLDVSELVVFSALVRWAESQCKRQHLTLTSRSKRRVLHDLIFLVRFLVMTDLEYHSTEDSGLLTPEENEVIRSMVIHGHLGFHPSTLTAYPALQSLILHWEGMTKPRLPKLGKNKGDFGNGMGGGGKKRKWSSYKEGGAKRKNSFKKVGGLVKNYCLPCTDNNTKRRHTEPQITSGGNPKQSVTSHDNNFSSYSNANQQDKTGEVGVTGGRRKKSTFAKALYLTVTVFAFFFD